jgi:hypothetical protein
MMILMVSIKCEILITLWRGCKKRNNELCSLRDRSRHNNIRQHEKETSSTRKVNIGSEHLSTKNGHLIEN